MCTSYFPCGVSTPARNISHFVRIATKMWSFWREIIFRWQIIEKAYTFLINCCVLDDFQKTQINSLFSELNFKVLEDQLENHFFFGGPCPKPEMLRSTRRFEKVNLENFGGNDVDLVTFWLTRGLSYMNLRTEQVELEDRLFTFLVHKQDVPGKVFLEINSFLMEKLRSTSKNCDDLHVFWVQLVLSQGTDLWHT